jgi:hypothetical protein
MHGGVETVFNGARAAFGQIGALPDRFIGDAAQRFAFRAAERGGAADQGANGKRGSRRRSNASTGSIPPTMRRSRPFSLKQKENLAWRC